MFCAKKIKISPAWATVVALVFSLGVFFTQISIAWNSPSRGADFNAYLVGSTLLELGHDPYSDDQELRNDIADERNLGTVAGPYRYPIHLAWLLQAFRDISPQTLWLVNAVLNIGAALLGVVLITRLLGGGWLYPLAVLLVGGSGPMAETILLGQVTGYVFLLLCVSQVALQRSRTICFASTVSLGVALKLVPIVLIPVAIAWHRYKLAVAGVIFTVVTFLLPVLVLGPEHLIRYFLDLRDIITPCGLCVNNQSIEAAFHRANVPVGVLMPVKLIILGVLTTLLSCQYISPNLTRGQAVLSAGICAALLVPTTAFYIYQLWLIFPVLFVFQSFWTKRQRAVALLLLAGYFLSHLLYVLPQILMRVTPNLVPANTGPYGWLGNVPAVYCLVLFIASAYLALRETPSSRTLRYSRG